MDYYCCYAVIVTILLLLHIVFDVNYFLRVIFTIACGRIFQTKKKVDETTEIYAVCTTNDLDIILRHMNNARFVRELDFARFHFYDITGFYKIMVNKKAHVFQTATNIRYRRTIPLFTPYKVTTKLIYWDDKMIYLEQHFISLTDGFVRATVLSRQQVVGLNVAEVMGQLLGKDPSHRLPMPPELEDWINSMEKSSAKLRKRD